MHSTGFVEHFFNRARKLHADGKPQDAKQEYLQLLEHDPQCAAAHFNIAQLYAGDEQWEQACTHYQQAVEGIDSTQKFLVHFCYGTALFRLGKLEEAKTQLDKSLVLHPTTKAHMQRSLVLQQLGKLDDARIDLDNAVKNETSYARGYIEIGNKYRDKQQFEQARNCYLETSKFLPDFYGSYLLCGDVLNMQGKQDQNTSLIIQAKTMYQKAIECNPTCYQAQLNLGLMHMEQNQDELAGPYFRQALIHSPEFKQAHLANGIYQLKQGNFIEGWQELEWRPNKARCRYHDLPEWDGIESIAGKRLLLHIEWGFGLGDTIQFIRFAQTAKERGAYVIVEVQSRLQKLFSLCSFIDEVRTDQDPIATEFDMRAHLYSMPYLTKTTINTIPQSPYLSPDQNLQSMWHNQLKQDTNFKIGICWKVLAHHDVTRYQNNNLEIQVKSPKRSIPIQKLEPLANLKGISLYALQKTATQDELQTIGAHGFGQELDEEHGGFMDTAAIMKELDLVITIDTSTAHLAGALGSPNWILLPFAPEWRWMKNRNDTPWYPSATLFRCKQKDKWEDLIQEVITKLKPLILRKAGRSIDLT